MLAFGWGICPSVSINRSSNQTGALRPRKPTKRMALGNMFNPMQIVIQQANERKMTYASLPSHHHPAEPSKRKKEKERKCQYLSKQRTALLPNTPPRFISYTLLSFDWQYHQQYQHFVNKIDHNRNTNQQQAQQFPLRIEI